MEGHGIDRMLLSFAPVYRQPPSSAAAGRVRCLGRAVSRARVLPRTRCDHVCRSPLFTGSPPPPAAGRVCCRGRAVTMYWVKRASGRAQAHWVTGFWKIPLGASSVKMRSLLQQMILSLLLTLCIRGTR